MVPERSVRRMAAVLEPPRPEEQRWESGTLRVEASELEGWGG